MAETVNVGILGKGTVGGAFKRLLEERAEMVEEVSGRRPKVAGVLSSKKGDFEKILSGSDIVVELIGGTDPAATTSPVRCARGGTSSPPTSNCSPNTVRSWSRRRGREAHSFASRPRSPVPSP